MNDHSEMARMRAELAPLPALLTAYAPQAQRGWHVLCWALDARLAAIVRRGGEPTIAAIRMAWWDAVLVDRDDAKGRGEPLVEAWREMAVEGVDPLTGQLIDGWRTLLGVEAFSAQDLVDFAAKRGGGLFGLLAAEQKAVPSDALLQAGTVWALWDLAGHARDPETAAMAIERAHAAQASGPVLRRADAPKPLRLLYGLASSDAQAGRIPKGGFEGRHYRALLWRSLLP